MAITIVTVTNRGIHLPASGFRDRADIVKHLRDRLGNDAGAVEFIVVDTQNNTTTVERLNRSQACGVCNL